MTEEETKILWHNEKRWLSDLIPYAHNPRTMTDKAAKRLTKSLKNTGYAEVIAINTDNIIVAGHQRHTILKQLNKQDLEIDVRVPSRTLTKKEFEDYLIASNKDIGDWDYDMLANDFDIDELLEKGFELSELGIDVVETIETEGDDETPEPPAEPKTVLGDLYELGDNRLVCGDATVITDVEKLMDGNKADMVFTDPPYNIDYKGLSNAHGKIKNDKMPDKDFVDFLTSSLYRCDTMYVCCSWQYVNLFKEAMVNIGRDVKSMIIWNKVNAAQHLDKYYKQHEIILYHGEFGGVKTLRGDIWELKRQRNTLHPTMKPVELIEMALLDNPSKKNILDLFGGSGSTLIACEKTNRKCYMMELDPRYCDVIVNRYKTFCEKNGKTPVIKRNGEVIDD